MSLTALSILTVVAWLVVLVAAAHRRLLAPLRIWRDDWDARRTAARFKRQIAHYDP